MNKEFYASGGLVKRNPTLSAELAPWKARHILKILKRNNLYPKSICEVGCGSGEVLNQLYVNMPGDTVFAGYDISPQAIDICRSKARERMRFYLNDLIEDNEDVFFDLILVIDVLEHIEDYIGFLKKLRQKSRCKIFHIPIDLSVQSVLRRSRLLLSRQPGHIHYFTKETALAVLKETGYEIIDCFYTPSFNSQPCKSFLSFLALLPRNALFAMNRDIAARTLGGCSLLVLTR